MSKKQAAASNGEQKSFLHKLFGSTPGDGEMQPKEGIAYSLCGFGQNMVCTVIGSYLTVFMTDAIGFAALPVALLMLFARIFDALNDPIMGSIVDRTRTKWGKCRPYLKWMAFPIAAMTVICFLPWFPDTPGGFAAISIMYVLWGMIYTVADVPYWGLSTSMSNDTYRRGNLLTIARLFCTVGAGIVTISVPLITSNTTAAWTAKLSDSQMIKTTIEQTQAVEDESQRITGEDITAIKGDLIGLLAQVKDYDNGGATPATTLEQIEVFNKYLNDKKHGEEPEIVAIREYLEGLNIKNQKNAETGEDFEYLFIVHKNGQYVLRSAGKALINVTAYDIEFDNESLQANIDNYQNRISNRLKWIYFIVAIVCVAVAIPLFFVGFKYTKERSVTVVKPPSLAHNLKLLFKNKPLMLIVLSGIGGAARMLFTYTGGLYFAKYVLADVVLIPGFMEGEALYTLFTVAIVPGGLIASVLVPYFTKKFGKRNTYIVSHIVGGVAMLIAFIVGITTSRGDYTGIACVVCLVIALVIAGVPVGFGNILQYAMIGDTVEYLELKTGERAEGICFAMQTLINKIGMAIGAFIGVLAYDMADVEANNPSAVTPENKDTMWIILMLVAAISFFLTVIPLFFYKFNEKQQQEAKAEIEKRKAAAAAAGGADIALDASGAAAVSGFAPTVVLSNENSEAVPTDENEEEKTAEDSKTAENSINGADAQNDNTENGDKNE